MSEKRPVQQKSVQRTQAAPARRPAAGDVRVSARPSASASQRPAGARTSANAKSTAARSNAARAAQVKRKKGKKKKSMLPMVIIIALIVLIGVGAAFLFLGGNDSGDSGKTPDTGKTPAMNASNATKDGANSADSSRFAALLENAAVSETNNSKLTGQRVRVSDLSVTQGLDPNWFNVLLLGADARDTKNPARTDTMMICSINKQTGEVKLSSIMRDTNVAFEGHSNARINSAYYFGGENLAMKVVNEYFGMNIEHFVYVEFSGFAAIAEILGGIEMDITENEMHHINSNVVEHYFEEIRRGSYTFDQAKEEYYATELKQFGKNVHLNGMQTLGYARIRKLDSDYARAERQRTVLNKMMASLQNASISELATLFGKCSGYFRTNIAMNDLLTIAQTVLNRSNFTMAEQMRLPVPGSYKEETRNDDARLYDMDVAQNTRELHNFIYR